MYHYSRAFPSALTLRPEVNASPAMGEIDLIQEIEARRRRAKFFPSDLFADYQWDMLLYLALRSLQQRRVTTSEVVAASGAPYTTGLRYLHNLVKCGLIEIAPDHLDRRRKFVSIKSETVYKISLAIGCAEV